MTNHFDFTRYQFKLMLHALAATTKSGGGSSPHSLVRRASEHLSIPIEDDFVVELQRIAAAELGLPERLQELQAALDRERKAYDDLRAANNVLRDHNKSLAAELADSRSPVSATCPAATGDKAAHEAPDGLTVYTAPTMTLLELIRSGQVPDHELPRILERRSDVKKLINDAQKEG